MKIYEDVIAFVSLSNILFQKRGEDITNLVILGLKLGFLEFYRLLFPW